MLLLAGSSLPQRWLLICKLGMVLEESATCVELGHVDM